ncbi:MAG TPA: NADPH-dependent F420 reductase [Candidatus Limnocylindrales bacterium]|nr:NADPH-dependent F420 reductase [Candidatus Limnocylindrales bacterium]
MKIAIIGAGNVGTALATSFKRAGHDVIITSRDPEDAGSVAVATGARVASTNAAAAAEAELVVLATPFSSAADVAREIATSVAGKPVVDVTNRMTYGAAGPEIDTTSSNAEDLAKLLPGAHVVKAFNTLFASKQLDPTGTEDDLDGFVAGDDAAANALVLELVASVGLHPIDVGPLSRARQLEGLAFLNISLNVAHGGAWQSAWKLIGAPATQPKAA